MLPATRLHALLLATIVAPEAAHAAAFQFQPGDLLVSSSSYAGTATTVTVGQPLPGGGVAVADGSFPGVFNNTKPDPSFGVTSPLVIGQYNVGTRATPSFVSAGTYDVTANTGVVTSFSSKSEGALNLSPGGHTLTLVDYGSAINKLDVSNSNTPGAIEGGNLTANPSPRTVVTLDANANATVTPTNAYPGNNGRAAITVGGATYLAGNAGNANGTFTNPSGSTVANPNGIQVLSAADTTTAGAADTTKAGSFSVAQTNPATGQPYATPAQIAKDKASKDDNDRGLTIGNNTLYTTKGSGGNGINSVYQVGTAGTLPTGNGSAPINILNGFPTALASAVTVTAGTGTNTNPNGLNVPIPVGKSDAGFYPFGLFFANANTLYVADEGDGKLTDAGTDIEAGLQKWSLVNGVWIYDYTLQNGLGLGSQYAVAGLPMADNPATDGLRDITGRINSDGTVTIFGITSTVSALGDQGADSNELVNITDTLAATALPTGEDFATLETAGFGQVLRGVSFAPVPEPASLALLGIGLASLTAIRRRRQASTTTLRNCSNM